MHDSFPSYLRLAALFPHSSAMLIKLDSHTGQYHRRIRHVTRPKSDHFSASSHTTENNSVEGAALAKATGQTRPSQKWRWFGPPLYREALLGAPRERVTYEFASAARDALNIKCKVANWIAENLALRCGFTAAWLALPWKRNLHIVHTQSLLLNLFHFWYRFYAQNYGKPPTGLLVSMAVLIASISGITANSV